MRVAVEILLLGMLLSIAGCGKHPAPPQPADAPPAASPAPSRVKLEACSLLTRDEIEAIQGSRITDEKSSEQSSKELRASQCYYTAAEANRSVSLGVTESLAESNGKERLTEYWSRMFGEHEAEEEGEKRTPPKKIENLGQEAYWIGTRVGGTLYVLKNGVFIRLSLGGPDNEQTKIDKTKKLAAKALERL